jgi:hypothetical protein
MTLTTKDACELPAPEDIRAMGFAIKLRELAAGGGRAQAPGRRYDARSPVVNHLPGFAGQVTIGPLSVAQRTPRPSRVRSASHCGCAIAEIRCSWPSPRAVASAAMTRGSPSSSKAARSALRSHAAR